jgi:hypothetical protein
VMVFHGVLEALTLIRALDGKKFQQPRLRTEYMKINQH